MFQIKIIGKFWKKKIILNKIIVYAAMKHHTTWKV